MTQQTVSLPGSSQAQLRQGRIVRGVRSVIRHLVLALLAGIWLVPIVWLVATSFSTDRGINVRRFFPRWLYTGQLRQHHVPPRFRCAVPAVVCKHLCGCVLYLRYLHLLCADGRLRIELLPL